MKQIHKRIHEEGTKAILIALAIIALLVLGINLLWPQQTVWHVLAYVFFAVVLALVVRFFRIPIHRKTSIHENAVVSPADGIVSADEVVMFYVFFISRNTLFRTPRVP